MLDVLLGLLGQLCGHLDVPHELLHPGLDLCHGDVIELRGEPEVLGKVVNL